MVLPSTRLLRRCCTHWLSVFGGASAITHFGQFLQQRLQFLPLFGFGKEQILCLTRIVGKVVELTRRVFYGLG